MLPLLLATRNAHKTRECSEMLGLEFIVRDLSGETDVPPVEETGSSFAENAVLKAIEVSRRFSDLVVADDSGLEVDALDGAPGVFSARYAGVNATDQANVERLLSELASRISDDPFTARFRCVLALARGGKVLGTFNGVVEGAIVAAPRGSSGFGYDPIFQPNGFDQTFAEMTAAEKNLISHRAGAIRAFRAAMSAQAQADCRPI